METGDIWLGNGTIRCHLGILVDIGSVFYTPEMTFSEESQFKCVFLPHRWLKRITLLDEMIEDSEPYFLHTFAFLDQRAQPALREAITTDISEFLTVFRRHFAPFATKWLSFPYIALGLGDPDVGKEIAKAMLLARGIDRSTYRRGTALVDQLTFKSLENSTHVLFANKTLFTSLQAFVARPLNHTTCAPLRTWLVSHGYSVSSNNVNVESSFNHLDNIIRAGGGCRKVSTEVSIQTHLQNVVLPSRQQMISPKTGGRQKWRATQTNLKLVEQSVNATIKSYKGLSLRREILSLSTQLYTYTCRWIVHDIYMDEIIVSFIGVKPRVLNIIEADYVAKFEEGAKRARPNQRKQYNSDVDAQALSVRRPYLGGLDDSSSSDSSDESTSDPSGSSDDSGAKEEEGGEQEDVPM